MTNYTENNSSPEIWDMSDYPWGQDINRDIYKVEYDRQKNKEKTYAELGLRLPPDHQHSTELAGYMRQLPGYRQSLNTQNTGLNEVDINATNDSIADNGNAKESRVTNNDGSITLTRERQFGDNGIIQTKIGRIRLMPQYETASGAPAIIGSLIKKKLFDLSEREIGNEILVFSGTRTPAQNDILVKRGIGAINSPHLSSNAADIQIMGRAPEEVSAIAFNTGFFNRVNSYPSGAVHVDTLPRPPGTTGYYNNWRRVPFPEIRTKPTPPKR
ncbi:MAG: DUF882 domain-containing protein [Kordiimonadaceae bacterium]|nr:DUF882 domain-containing protein [Kordiimonadaceae bacterium]